MPGTGRNEHARARVAVSDGRLRTRRRPSMPALSTARVMHPLIGSDRIEGTLVCRPDGTQLGTVERLMVNKISGQVAYLVVVKCLEHPVVSKMRFPIRW